MAKPNFLDTDDSLLEKNLKFIKNEVEEELDQMFGSGNAPNNTTVTPPPRDFKIVTPKPGSQTVDEGDSSNDETTPGSFTTQEVYKAARYYRSSKRYVIKAEKKDPNTLSAREKALLKKHRKSMRQHERQLAMTNTIPTVTSQHLNAKKPDSDEVSAAINNINHEQAGNNPTNSNTNLTTSSMEHQATTTSNLIKNEKRPITEEATNTEGVKKIKATPIDLKVTIIDRNETHWKITPTNWLLVENEILKTMMASSDVYIFNGNIWLKGIKVIYCGNQKSREFLTNTIANIGELWEGASLEVLPLTALTHSQRIEILIPPPVTHDNSAIIKLLAKQNREFPIKEWMFLQSKKSLGGEGKDFLFIIDEKSDLLLKEKEDVLRYGLGVVEAKRLGGNGSKVEIRRYSNRFNVPVSVESNEDNFVLEFNEETPPAKPVRDLVDYTTAQGTPLLMRI